MMTSNVAEDDCCGLHEDCVFCGTDAGAPARERASELTYAGLRSPLSHADATELRQCLLPQIAEALAHPDGTDCLSRHELDGVAIALRDMKVAE